METLTGIHEYAPLFKILVTDNGVLYGQIYTDINDQRIRLIYQLPRYPNMDLSQSLSSMCQHLASQPLINLDQLTISLNLPPHKLDHIRHDSHYNPHSLLEQCFCLVDTDCNNQTDMSFAQALGKIFPNCSSFDLIQLDLVNYVQQGHHHPLPLNDKDLALTYSDMVKAYYHMLQIFSPTINHYVPTFQDFSLNTAEHCHLVQRSLSGVQGILWAQVLPDCLIVRLFFKLSSQSVWEPLIYKAIGYAMQRGKSKVYLFVPVLQQAVLGRYTDMGFTQTMHTFHCFSF